LVWINLDIYIYNYKDILMLKWLKALFEVPKKEETLEAPYKVEAAPEVVAPVAEVTKPVRKPRAKPAAKPVPKPEVQPAAKTPTAKPKRTTVNGKFVRDDPATPENEAWVGGVAPPKKPKAPRKPKSQA
jgi:hypothetical protein